MIRVYLILVGLRRLNRRILLGDRFNVMVRVYIPLDQELASLPVDCAEISSLWMEPQVKVWRRIVVR